MRQLTQSTCIFWKKRGTIQNIVCSGVIIGEPSVLVQRTSHKDDAQKLAERKKSFIYEHAENTHGGIMPPVNLEIIVTVGGGCDDDSDRWWWL